MEQVEALNNSSHFFSINELITKQRALNFIVGSRGKGKTFTVLEYFINRYIKHGEQWIYMRKTETELQLSEKFILSPIIIVNSEKYKGFEFRFTKKEYQIKFPNRKNWETMGYSIALSTNYKLKGRAFPKVRWLAYDEFIEEKGMTRSGDKDEVTKLFNVLETVFRNRKGWQAFLIGNAITFETPYKYELGLQLPYNDKEYWLHKTKPISVTYIENGEYLTAKQQSLLGQLSRGTEYEQYAIQNSFRNDNNLFIKKKVGNYRKFYTFNSYGRSYAFYESKERDHFIIDKLSLTDNSKINYTFKDEKMDDRTSQILTRQNPHFKKIKLYYEHNRVFYQNRQVKTELFDTIYNLF